MFHILNRVQRDTRICPYFVIFYMLYSLPLSHPMSLPIFPCHFSIPYPPASADAASVSIVPARSSPTSSHHQITTRAPGVLSTSSHSSRSFCVAMNCATVLCLLRMYSSVVLNPASSLVADAEVYSHLLSVRCGGILSVNFHATWSWKPPMT